MCGRVTIHYRDSLVGEMLAAGTVIISGNFKLDSPTWNGAPSLMYRLLAGGEERGRCRPAQAAWGLAPAWRRDDDFRMINARSETAAFKPMFRNAMAHGRAVLPVSGWYEWQKAGGRRGGPFHIAPEDGRPALLAAIIEPGGAGEPDTFAVLTRNPAQSDIARIHHRQPSVLDPGDVIDWLDANVAAKDAGEIARRAGRTKLEAKAADPAVGNPRNNHPGLLAA